MIAKILCYFHDNTIHFPYNTKHGRELIFLSRRYYLTKEGDSDSQIWNKVHKRTELQPPVNYEFWIVHFRETFNKAIEKMNEAVERKKFWQKKKEEIDRRKRIEQAAELRKLVEKAAEEKRKETPKQIRERLRRDFNTAHIDDLIDIVNPESEDEDMTMKERVKRAKRIRQELWKEYHAEERTTPKKRIQPKPCNQFVHQMTFEKYMKMSFLEIVEDHIETRTWETYNKREWDAQDEASAYKCLDEYWEGAWEYYL